ncbi:MAG: hypothetical protein WDW38_009710 [Sanguina aurantia]
MTPSVQELDNKERIMEAVTEAVMAAFPRFARSLSVKLGSHVRGLVTAVRIYLCASPDASVAGLAQPHTSMSISVQPFGSHVSGLGMPQSDIDVVVVGLAAPDPGCGFYEKHQRGGIAEAARRAVIEDQGREFSPPRLARPRVGRPATHMASTCTSQFHILTGAVAAPHDDRAACRKGSAIPAHHPVLRPSKLLTIRHSRIPIIKLVTGDGNNVDISVGSCGGPDAARHIRAQVSQQPQLRPLVLVLKSYLGAQGLNMVQTGGLSSYGLTYMVLAHLLEEAKVGRSSDDTGSVLHRFLRRFGSMFDARTMAVSVQHGGLALRSELGPVYSGGNLQRIAVRDPLTGRDCTEGTFRANEVLSAFQRADRFLTATLKHAKDGNVLDAMLMPMARLGAPGDEPQDADDGDDTHGSKRQRGP